MAIVTTTNNQYGKYNRHYIQNFGTVQDVYESVNVIAIADSQTRNSVRTSGFQLRKKLRLALPNNPFSFSKERRSRWFGTSTSKPLSLTARPSTYGYYWSEESGIIDQGYGTGCVLADVSTMSTIRGQASNKLRLKIKKQSVNLAQMYAERSQTARTVGDSALAMAKALINLKQGNFKAAASNLGVTSRKRAESRFNRAKRQGDHVATGWLALQYGWKPLLNDVYGSCEALANTHRDPMIIKATARQRRLIDLTQRTDSGGIPRTIYTVKGQNRVTVTYSCTYRVSQPMNSVLSSLGISNPLVIAWELMPWSFVIDWFIPIGNFLQTLDATVGLEFVGGYCTEFEKAEAVATLSTIGPSGSQMLIKDLKTSELKVRVLRSPLGSFPSPSLPRFKDPRSLIHAANGIALLYKQLRK